MSCLITMLSDAVYTPHIITWLLSVVLTLSYAIPLSARKDGDKDEDVSKKHARSNILFNNHVVGCGALVFLILCRDVFKTMHVNLFHRLLWPW